IVPGSTLRYGSNFWKTTRKPRSSSRVPSEAAARPLPNELTTPPVMKMYFMRECSLWRERVFAPALPRAPEPSASILQIAAASRGEIRRYPDDEDNFCVKVGVGTESQREKNRERAP